MSRDLVSSLGMIEKVLDFMVISEFVPTVVAKSILKSERVSKTWSLVNVRRANFATRDLDPTRLLKILLHITFNLCPCLLLSSTGIIVSMSTGIFVMTPLLFSTGIFVIMSTGIFVVTPLLLFSTGIFVSMSTGIFVVTSDDMYITDVIFAKLGFRMPP